MPALPHILKNRRRQAPHISPYVSAHIQTAVRAALKDPVGRRDFALAADGARIATKLTSTFESLSDLSAPQPPENVLDEDMRAISHWLLPNGHGQVGIKLPSFVYPTNVTIDHIPKEIAADIHQAPRHMVLWGMLEGRANERRRIAWQEKFRASALALNLTRDAPPITNNATFLPIAAFEYDIHAEYAVQTFPVDALIVDSCIYFGAVVLEVQTNWGAPSTRLYRVRIHGNEISE
ncbi:hypothetical protein L226DRAFT_474545 [Lentinus tigrinus ALCF2SS1-7]|uniref:uncharacterized protein n=1 Tax=Lentinus tigrinus ALCF2SS1-7 TaxID=1328758 RepID=UPI001165CC40|nr:hypothetical protein L226DRAFT_474545 [Lentinus tigrinus ALCF2SS1-7]